MCEIISEGQLFLMQAESRIRHAIERRPRKKQAANGFTKEAVEVYNSLQKNADQEPPKASDFLPEHHAPVPEAETVAVVAPADQQEPEIGATIKEVTQSLPPKQEKKWAKPVQRVPVIADEPVKKEWVRPKAEYDNHKSFYGIYAEMQREMVKKQTG